MIRVLYGPPGAGKTTYIAEHRRAGDIVVDLDALCVAFGSADDHDHHGLVQQVAGAARASAIRKVIDLDADAWAIDTWLRTRALREHEACEYILVDPGLTVVLGRAGRAGRPQASIDAIHRWYANPPRAPQSATPAVDADQTGDLGAGSPTGGEQKP